MKPIHLKNIYKIDTIKNDLNTIVNQDILILLKIKKIKSC